MTRFLVPLMACCLVGSDTSFGQDAAAAPTEHSLVYKTVTVDGVARSLRIDWTGPPNWAASDSRPAIVFFHGGGWTGGRPGQFASHSVELAALGVVCFRVEYRLLDKNDRSLPVVCVEDASDAFRYVRSHAGELGVDPARIAAGGGSAGGHLAAFLGMMDDETLDGVSRKPAALLLFNPVFDNGPGGWGTARVGKLFADYSPAHNISSDDPPAIVFLGTKDKLIPVSTAQKFQSDSEAVGLTSELHLYDGRQHGFFNETQNGGKDYRDTMTKSVEFLQRLGWI